MEKVKEDVITDAAIDDKIRHIQDIRSKYPQKDAYKVIKVSAPFLEPLRLRLIDEYLVVVDEIVKDKKFKKKPSKTKRQYYLRRLLTPLVKLNRLHPQGENPYLNYDGTYPFIDEAIDLEKETDMNSLKYDKQRYSINFNENGLPLNPDEKNITIWDDYKRYMEIKRKKDTEAKAKGIRFIPITPLDVGKTSIRELYKKWLLTLTQDKMKSKDLLDQLLVTYTIKRALNGDPDAIDKLYSLYENTAIGIAVIMARKRKLNKEEFKEIKQEAKTCLRFLISGFRPEDIMNGIELPLQIKKFYCWYFSEYVPNELNKILKREPHKLDGVEIDYLLNPISIIDANTLWQNTPKRVVKFNSYSFRPTNGKYLTTWLFGNKTQPMQGKFYQLISNSIDDYWKMKKEKLNDPSDEIEHIENFKPQQWEYICPQCKASVQAYIQPKKCKDHESFKHPVIPNWLKKNTIEFKTDDATINKAFKKLIEDGILKRHAEIFLKHKLQGYKQTELAMKYSLSRMQIYRICKKLSLTYPL